MSELYSYDGLNRLVSFDRGTLNANKDGISGTASRSQDWTWISLGNWLSLTTDGSTETRSFNAQNQITSISNASTPSYDANGNMTADQTGQQSVYDAWNRVVEVKDSGGHELETFEYDALGRKMTQTPAGAAAPTCTTPTAGRWWRSGWGAVLNRWFWSAGYVDCRLRRNGDVYGPWFLTDINHNVTAGLGGGGVVERYAYDPYGTPTVLTGTWGDPRQH